MKTMQKSIYTLLFSLLAVAGWSQVNSSVSEGCAPLSVSFTGPTTPLSVYYWDFGDGGGPSDEVAPSRTFDMPGTYTIELFEGLNGPSRGSTVVTVYDQPDIQISATVQAGCAPLFVEFTNESIVDPNITITGYQWTFGDGGSSTFENPTHSYLAEGTYPVSLTIFAEESECQNVATFTDYVTVAGSVPIGFTVSPLSQCDAPATFTITNTTPDNDDYSYAWDFGNGTTSTDEEPGEVTYTEEGTYVVRLDIDNGECVVTRQQTVRVGGPAFFLGFNDTICIDVPTEFLNTTSAALFSWTFGVNAFPETSTDKSPMVTFDTPGLQLITLSATSAQGCVSDTIISIFVEEVDASFTVDPPVTCADPATFILTANDPNLAAYIWNSAPGGNIFTFEYDDPVRDSFYINRVERIPYTLIATSFAGCTGQATRVPVFRDIEAHFIPSSSRGCTPLEVTFDQLSQTPDAEGIISYDWDFGDGTTLNTTDEDDQIHIYTEPGEYYVKLIVENTAGCIDTSTGVWIYVGELIESNVVISDTSICIGDSITLEALNLDDRIDAWHFDTDDSRNSHCYTQPSTSHQFITAPGSYPIELEIEYNGCISNVNVGTVEVEGAKALIQYMMDCSDPYTVMLQDSSIGATRTEWVILDDTIQTGTLPDSILNYTFDTAGVYSVYLYAYDDNGVCPVNIDSAEIHIVDVHASFVVPAISCEGPITLDASSSIGADDRCHKGYTWYLPTNRPRRVGMPVIEQGFFQGPEPNQEWDVRLEVEDINGCVDDTTITIRVMDIDADFTFDREATCFPSELTVTDASISDTTIVSWTWSTSSSTDSVATFLATEQSDSIYSVSLIVEDALGCIDTIERSIDVYEIESFPTIAPNPSCVGDTVTFFATDYVDGGSFLNFQWNIPGVAASDEQTFDIVFDQAGTYTAELTIEEDATGCTNSYEGLIVNIVDIPVASFTSSPAPPSVICAGTNVEFINNSTGSDASFWSFSGGLPGSQLDNPVITFPDAGTYDVELISVASAGCSDIAFTTIDVVAPSAQFTVSETEICRIQDVTFQVFNTENVASFAWDFGDGEGVRDTTPYTHQYELVGSQLNELRVILTLFGDDAECSAVLDTFITITGIRPGFRALVDSTVCPGTILIDSVVTDYATISYAFNGGDPVPGEVDFFEVSQNGAYAIRQVVTNEDGTCTSELVRTVNITNIADPAVPNLFTPNGDGNNDFFNVVLLDYPEECYEVQSMKIFDRFGKLVYDNDTPNQGWDGNINGQEAASDVYIYVLEVDVNGEPREPFKGQVFLKY